MPQFKFSKSTSPRLVNTPQAKHRRLGEILVEAGYVDPDNLLKALALQKHEDASLGQILVLNNHLTPANLAQALSDQSEYQFDYRSDWVDIDVSSFPVNPRNMIELEFVPTAWNDSHVDIAFHDPSKLIDIRNLCASHALMPKFKLAHRDKIFEQIHKIAKSLFTQEAELSCPSDFACRASLNFVQTPIWAFVSILFISIFLAPMALVNFVIFVSLLLTFANIALKAACLYRFIRPLTNIDESNLVAAKKLERVSLLVPVFHEAGIVERLVQRLQNLDYPKELLEIILICEDADQETYKALNALSLPDHFQVLSLTEGQLQTKPRAMNFALNFSTGSIIGVYDAEDAPEVSQVYKAVRHLQRASEKVACVQARLDFFNQDTNLLSRCFTIEYAVLFRVYLKGLCQLKLPVLLGGTSMFIKRDILTKIGGWDAHNVTEDADLGVRLFRHGYKVEPLDSTTYEEANYGFRSWVKQRSRWLKGFFWTWITAMKNPINLYKELSFWPFICLQVQLFSVVATYLVLPFILPLWTLSLGLSWGDHISGFFLLFLLLLLVGEPMQMVAGYFALSGEKHMSLRKFLPLMIFYWPLASFAAYKAFWEILFAPCYWDKTKHGLNDALFKEQIRKLTNN